MQYKIEHKLIDTLIVMLLVFSSGGLLFVFNRNIMYGAFFLLLAAAFIFTGRKIKKNVFNASFLTLILVITLFGINYLFAVSEQAANKYFYYLMVIVISTLTLVHFYNNRSKEIFVSRLHFILKLIVIHAFIQAFAYLFVSGALKTIVHAEYECDTFNYVFYFAFLEEKKYAFFSLFGLDIIRNQGLFWEAGVAQVFFNIFFFLEAHIIKRSKLLLILTAITILTTYSTAGIAILILQLIYYVIVELRKNMLIIPIIIITAIPVYNIFTENLQAKFVGEQEASFQKRFFDMVQPFFIALENPMTGIGLDLYKFQEYRYNFFLSSSTFENLQEQTGVELKMSGTDQGSSNSFMFLFAAMGFPTGLFFIYMFLKQKIIAKRNEMLIVIIILSLISSPLFLRPFFFVFILSGIMHTASRIQSQTHQIS